MSFWQSRIMCIFPNGWIMNLVKKLKFPRFLGNGLRYDSLWCSREKGALDYKKVILTLVKNLKFLLSLLFSEEDLGVMLHDVLDWKEGFLNYKNIIFYKKGLDMIFDDDLHKKEAFLDYYYDILTSLKN